jgi:hypothetical protein
MLHGSFHAIFSPANSFGMPKSEKHPKAKKNGATNKQIDFTNNSRISWVHNIAKIGGPQ